MLKKNIFGWVLSCLVLTYSVGLPGLMGWNSAREAFQKTSPKKVTLKSTDIITQSGKKTNKEPKSLAKTVNQIQPPQQPAETKQPDYQVIPKKSAQSNRIAQANQTENNYQSSLKINDYQFNTLVRIISAEAKGETLEGQVAVGAVILNRVESGKFPDTIAKNVFKSGQFEPVANGHIWNTPTASAYKAAELAIKGWDPTNGALYFFNPSTSSSRWIWSRPIIKKIGDHVFAS